MKRVEMPKIDVTKYVGTKSFVVISEARKVEHGMVLFLQTAPIDLKEGDTMPDGKVLSASIMLGFQEMEDGSFRIGIDTKLDKFLNSHGVNSSDIPDEIEDKTEIPAFLNKQVVVQKNNKSGYLEIA
jgi:hypothetical protein